MAAWQGNVYFWPLIANALIAILVSVIAWRRQGQVPGAVTVSALMLANAIWAGLYAFELAIPILSIQVWLAKIEYIGILSLPMLWLLFTIQYTRRSAWLTPRNILAASIIPLGLFGLVLTNEWHYLFWSAFRQVQFGGRLIFEVTHGPAFYVNMAYAYLLLLTGSGLLIQAGIESPDAYRRQIRVMLLGAFAPWLGNLLYITRLNPWPLLDLTPFAFTITGVMVVWGIARFNLLGIIPLARSQAVDNMREGIILLDASGQIIDLNPASRGFIPDKLAPIAIGKLYNDAFNDWPELLAVLNTQGNQRALIERLSTGQTFDMQVTPINQPGAEGCRMVTLSDVTEHIHIETALRQARDLAESASGAKSAFLATISHELRTPMTVIMGYSEMLLDEARAAEQEQTAIRLERIQAAAKHLLDMVNDVLDLSRIEAGRMLLDLQWFDVTDLIQQTETLGHSLAEQNGNTFEVEYEEDLGRVYSDITRVRQVLINLLSNAARFTQSGVITLSARRYSGPDCDDWLSFSVRDTGLGMSAEQMSGLFQPFSQVESPVTRRRGGAGLGLAISRRLCQMLGGEVSVESWPGKGSTFTVILPASTKQA